MCGITNSAHRSQGRSHRTTPNSDNQKQGVIGFKMLLVPSLSRLADLKTHMYIKHLCYALEPQKILSITFQNIRMKVYFKNLFKGLGM